MRVRIVLSFLVCFGGATLVGCTWVRDVAVDQAAGFPASSVMKDAKRASDEYEEEQSEERAEELSDEYEEYRRSRDQADDEQDGKEKSLIIKSNNE